jgi:hypothetical protein
MKKSLLAIVFAAASLPLTFAQTTPANQGQSTPDQKSTATTKKTKKSNKHNSKKTSAKHTGAPTTPPQK